MGIASRLWTSAAACCLASIAPAQARPADSYLPVGLFFGRIEEGARVFTPARLLPLDHPESLGHDFPTVLQLHATEFPALLWLGRQAGLQLWATLQRYPTEPSPDWPYDGHQPPPDSTALRGVPVHRLPNSSSPLPGLRAALFHDRHLVAFIVDTRSLSLAERGMTAPTTMGLDMTRAQFLELMARAAAYAPAEGFGAVVVPR